MIFSPNKVIGSLLYRTVVSLNENKLFLDRLLSSYKYAEDCFVGDKFMIWYYPGTHNEISEALIDLSKNPNTSRCKFPALFNFQSIRQDVGPNFTTILYNIALCGVVDGEKWLTEDREAQVFDLLLRPIYAEFMKQVLNYPFFSNDYGMPRHTLVDRFTTGKDKQAMIDAYADYIDAIELQNLQIRVKSNLCRKDLALIEQENRKLIELITT